MSLSGCLVTSSPTFEDPKQTRPFLIAEGASPDVRQIKVVDLAKDKSLPLDFDIAVISEDAGARVWGRPVLDYGVQGGSRPYNQALGDARFINPATMADGPRTLTARWETGITVALGCHYVSVLASHDFDVDSGCPSDPSDFDFLTWTVNICNSGDGPCCDPTAPADEGGCSASDCPAIDPEVRCDKPAGGGPP